MPKVNKVYVWKKNILRNLPSTYQEVEYIESNGSQYINSGYKPNGNTKVACKFAHNENAIDTPVFGCRTSSSNYQYILWSHPAGYTGGATESDALFSVGSSWTSTTTGVKALNRYNAGEVIEFEYDKTGGKYGDQTWTRSLSGGTPNVNMMIFTMMTGSSVDSRKFAGKMWYFKIWESGTLKRDMVPCYRKSDGVIGMYDLVNSTFYTNAGSGAFRRGKDMVSYEEKQVRPNTTLPSAYQQVEYIQSSATNPGTTSSSGQYIDTNYVINKNIKLEIDIQYTSTATQQRLFGGGYDNNESTGITFDGYINSSTQWARATKNGYGNRQTTNVSANTNRNTFILDNSKYMIYGSNWGIVYNTSNDATITNSDTWTIPLLARNYRTGNKIRQHSSAKLYSCRIWDSGVLVRSFVPCYRKSDSVIGLFDLVGQKFYPNNGTGTFTKGVNVGERLIPYIN